MSLYSTNLSVDKVNYQKLSRRKTYCGRHVWIWFINANIFVYVITFMLTAMVWGSHYHHLNYMTNIKILLYKKVLSQGSVLICLCCTLHRFSSRNSHHSQVFSLIFITLYKIIKGCKQTWGNQPKSSIKKFIMLMMSSVH